MHQTALDPFFLRVYNADLGLWDETILGSPVSPLSLEAMNLILLKDGILAYIGPRSGFGQYLTGPLNETGMAKPPCWISLPASTVRAKLGLCLNTATSGKPEMVFYGSPLTRALAYLLGLRHSKLDFEKAVLLIANRIHVHGSFHFIFDDVEFHVVSEGPGCIYATELTEALKYLDDVKE